MAKYNITRFLLLAFFFPQISQALQIYEESDLGFSCKNSGITFFNRHNSKIINEINSNTQLDGKYQSAVIYSNKSKISDLTLHQFQQGPLHYLCLDKNILYKGLSDLLYQKNDYFLTEHLPNISSTVPSFCPESSLAELSKRLRESETVCITFGAGLSSGYVPTLIDIFNKLNLEKEASNDLVTEESFERFVNHLLMKKDSVLSTIQTEWAKVLYSPHDTTPAHEALKKLIDFLEIQGKDVFVYTDNIDGIDEKVNIKLSEQELPKEEDNSNDRFDKILYPPLDTMHQKKVTVLVCGQSFDFHYVLSTIHSRCRTSQEVIFFNLNISSSSFNIYKGLDVDICTQNPESVETSDFHVESLPMLHIPGSLHDTLPQLYQMLLDPQ